MLIFRRTRCTLPEKVYLCIPSHPLQNPHITMRLPPLLPLLALLIAGTASMPRQGFAKKARHFAQKEAVFSQKVPALLPDSAATPTEGDSMLQIDSTHFRFILTHDSAHTRTAVAADSLHNARADSLLRHELQRLDSVGYGDSTIVLQDFVVKARKPDVINRGDTIIYNAENFQLPTHAKLRDLLRLLPGVEVNDDGSVLVNGQPLSSLYIDSRYFRLADLDQAIDMLPSDIVSRLKVYRRPSREEELTGISTSSGETVLDISVKDDMQTSLQADAELHAGRDLGKAGKMRDGGSLQSFALNHKSSYNARIGWSRNPYERLRNARKEQNFSLGADQTFSDKLSTTAFFNGINHHNISRSETNSRTFLPDSTEQARKGQDESTASFSNYGLNLQTEWKPNERNTLSANVSFSTGQTQTDNSSRFSAQTGTGDTLYYGASSTNYRTRNFNLNAQISHSLRLRKKGRVLFTQINFTHNKSHGENRQNWLRHEYEDGLYRRDSLLETRGKSLNSGETVHLYLSWVEPLGKRHKLQVAGTFDFSENRSTSSSFEAADGTMHLSVPLSNENRQEQSSQQIRLFLRSVWEKYEQNIGLSFDRIDNRTRNFAPTAAQARPEYGLETDIDHLPEMTADSLLSQVTQATINFSPQFNFRWQPAPGKSLSGAYNGRLNSPSPYQLNDYLDVSNPENTVQGNPNLKPTFNHSFSLTYQSPGLRKKGNQYAMFQGNVISNEIKTVYNIDTSTGHRYTTYRNINGNYSLSGNYNLTQPLDKAQCWNLNAMAGGTYRHSQTYTNGQFFTLRPYSLSTRLGLNFHKQEWNAGLYGYFRYERTQNGTASSGTRHQKDWAVQATGYARLPGKIYLDTDFNWTLRRGYGDGADYGRAIWNIRLTRDLFRVPLGTASLTLEARDFLPGNVPILRTNADNVQTDYRNTYRESYLMATFRFHFDYRFGRKDGKEG